MTSLAAPMCYWCAHKQAGLTCTAYPDRIPDPILESGVDHRKPFAGDRGIVFQEKPGDPLPAYHPMAKEG